MSKKLVKLLKIWVPIIMILPFVFILGIPAILKLFISTKNKDYIILLFDLSQGMSIGNFMEIYAAFAGICVTFFLGVVIYQLNTNKEESDKRKQQESDKLYLLKEMTTYIDKIYARMCSDFKSGVPIFRSSFDKSLFEVDDKWKDKLFAITESIAEKQYNTLYQFFFELEGLFRGKSMYEFVKKFTIPFYAYQVSNDELKQVESMYDVLSYDLYLAINTLKGTVPSSGRKVYYATGQLFYEEDSKGTKYKLFDLSGNKVQDFDFDNQIGFKTIRNDDGIISSQGKYVKNRLMNGLVNNGLCNEDGKYEGILDRKIDEEVNEDEYNEKIKKDKYLYVRYANFKVIDGEYHIDSEIKYGKYNLI